MSELPLHTSLIFMYNIPEMEADLIGTIRLPRSLAKDLLMFPKAKWIVVIVAALSISYFLKQPEIKNAGHDSRKNKAAKIHKPAETGNAASSDYPDSRKPRVLEKQQSPSERAGERVPSEDLRSRRQDSSLGTASGHQTPDSSRLAYNVVRVVDGDTLILQMDGKPTRIRLIGVDTPETVHPKKAVQYYGKEASRFLKNLLNGEKVWVEYEPASSGKDKYQRTLAYLYRVPDGLFINAEIIRQGYGHAYTRFPFQYMEDFRALEQSAREAKRGLWADPEKPSKKSKAEGPQ